MRALTDDRYAPPGLAAAIGGCGKVKLTVNGDPLEVPQGTTVTQLLDRFKLKPELVVVELNLNILRRDELRLATLSEGDRVEIVHFVGGGAR